MHFQFRKTLQGRKNKGRPMSEKNTAAKPPEPEVIVNVKRKTADALNSKNTGVKKAKPRVGGFATEPPGLICYCDFA